MYFNWGALKTTYTTAFTLAFKQVINPMPVSEKLPIANIQNIVSVMLHITNRVTTTMTIEATLFSEFCDEAEDCIVLANCLLVCLTWKARKSILFLWFSRFDMRKCVNYLFSQFLRIRTLHWEKVVYSSVPRTGKQVIHTFKVMNMVQT